MSVLTPYRSELSSQGDGFAQLLRAEWTKSRTVRGWVIGAVVGGLLIIALGVLTSANSVCSMAAASPHSPNRPPQACPAPATGPGGGWVSDSYYFVSQPLAGNGTLTVRVTSLTGLYSNAGRIGHGPNPLAGMRPGPQPWSKAGIIIRASTTRGSAYAAMIVTGSHGVRMQWNFTRDRAGIAGKVSAKSPRWLRLTRSGDVIRGYDSADGRRWTLVGTATLAGLRTTVQAGLFAASPGYTVTTTSVGTASAVGGPTLATATFDRLSERGSWPAGRWTGQDIMRRSAAAVTAVIAGIDLPYLLAVITGVLPVGAEEWPARVTPAAAFAIQQATPAYPQVEATYTPGTGYFPLSPRAGFAVLCGWAAVFLALAAFRLHRRDA